MNIASGPRPDPGCKPKIRFGTRPKLPSHPSNDSGSVPAPHPRRELAFGSLPHPGCKMNLASGSGLSPSRDRASPRDRFRTSGPKWTSTPERFRGRRPANPHRPERSRGELAPGPRLRKRSRPALQDEHRLPMCFRARSPRQVAPAALHGASAEARLCKAAPRSTVRLVHPLRAADPPSCGSRPGLRLPARR